MLGVRQRPCLVTGRAEVDRDDEAIGPSHSFLRAALDILGALLGASLGAGLGLGLASPCGLSGSAPPYITGLLVTWILFSLGQSSADKGGRSITISTLSCSSSSRGRLTKSKPLSVLWRLAPDGPGLGLGPAGLAPDGPASTCKPRERRRTVAGLSSSSSLFGWMTMILWNKVLLV